MSKKFIKNTVPFTIWRGQTRHFGEKLKNVAGDPMPSNWAYGGLCHGEGAFSIIYGTLDEKGLHPLEKHPVYTDTVGMYIHRDYLIGENESKMAFTGDICEVTQFLYGGGDEQHICLLEFDEGSGTIHFKYYKHGEFHYIYLYDIGDFESDVVYLGDIFDNPDLVEKLGFPESCTLFMCSDKDEYESGLICKSSSLTIECDSFEDAKQKAKQSFYENIGDFYGFFITDAENDIVFQKVFHKEGSN